MTIIMIPPLLMALLLQTLLCNSSAAEPLEAWGAENCGVQIGINLPPSSRPRVGKGLEIVLRIKNSSNRDIVFLESTPRQDLDVLLLDSAGLKVTPKAAPGNEDEFARARVRLKPTQVHQLKFDLNDFYRLQASGRYSVQVRRKMPSAEGKPCEVSSNILSLNLLP